MQIIPGAKTWATGPGGVCPKYGPVANGFAHTVLLINKAIAKIQYLVYPLWFITGLLSFFRWISE